MQDNAKESFKPKKESISTPYLHDGGTSLEVGCCENMWVIVPLRESGRNTLRITLHIMKYPDVNRVPFIGAILLKNPFKTVSP